MKRERPADVAAGGPFPSRCRKAVGARYRPPMPSDRSRDFHQPVPSWEAAGETGPGWADPTPEDVAVVGDALGGMGGSGLAGACCTRAETREGVASAAVAAEAVTVELGSAALVDGLDGAAGSFQAGANGCFVLAFCETMWLAVGWPITARSIESLVAS